MNKKIVVMLVFVFIITSYLCADGSGGRTAGNVLLINPNASVNGIGNSGVGLRKAGWQFVELNPAHVSVIQKRTIGFTYNKYIESTNQQYLQYISEIEAMKYSISLNYFDYGDIDRSTYSTHSGLGNFSANDYIISFAVSGYKIGSFNTGVSIKYFREKIDDKNASSIIMDLGILYSSKKYPFSFGCVVKNIGRRLKYQQDKEDLPKLVKFGLSYDLFDGNVVLSCDWQKIFKEDDSFKIGACYTFNNYLDIRAGYDNENEASKGMTFGFGMYVSNKFSIDYAFIPYNTFDSTHRISFAYSFK